jgi:spermidine/putrescine transport system ATP-binding protein
MSDGVIEQVADGKTVYDQPQTAFVASFVGENNPFTGKVVAADATGAVVETAMGRLRGTNPNNLKMGDKAILFVRPENLKLGKGAADASFSAPVKSVAFEGNMTHVYLNGPTRKDITVTVGRHGGKPIPGQGASAAVNYDPGMGLVLPEGKMARE